MKKCSINNLHKKGNRKGCPYEYAFTPCVGRGYLYGRPYACLNYLQGVKKCFFTFFFLFITFKSTAQITILPVFGDKPITEDTWFVNKNGDSIQFDNIRFYLSNIELGIDDKTWVNDTSKAHLIDVFEPNSLKINYPKIAYKYVKSIRFNIGIDSLTNVSGALSGDLDPQKGMYWAWQSGYVNMKIEGRSPQCKSRKNVFQYHIGGYLPPFYAMKHVELPILDVYTEGVILKIDFSKFFESIQVATQNSIMMPCKEAVALADLSVLMFSISK
jgi:hypothetical protein